KKYETLYEAAVARSESDWYVGLNATRALTTKYDAQLSSGRVQTPTLGIVHAREEEIRHFKPAIFYEMQANIGGKNFTWRDAKNNSRIFDEANAKQLQEKLNGAEAIVEHVERKEKKKTIYTTII